MMIKNIGLICLICLIPNLSLSQEFGKNKVRYKGFTWQILQAEHFEVYHNPEIEDLARIAAKMAEDAYEKIGADLKYDVSKPIPFVIFKSHYDFQQTNIILELIEKGVGGFTEIFKYRMVIPFTGSYKAFQTVITHELTHVFQYDILYHDTLPAMFSVQAFLAPPLWLMEGLAEYETGDLDTMGHTVLADAVLENNLIPLSNLADFSGISRVYLAYKESHSLLRYIARTYGADKIHLLLRRFKAHPSVESMIKTSLGVSLETLENGWRKSLQQQYYPELIRRKLPTDFGKRLIEERQGFYSHPTFSPGGDMLALISYEFGEAEVVLVRVSDGQVLKRITRGMSAHDFEELNTEERPLAWSPDGTKIAFTAKTKGKDAIFIFDVFTSTIKEVIKPDKFDEISSISFSPNSKGLAVSALSNGKSKIYLLEDDKIEPLTSGDSLDHQPIWSNDGEYIAFIREKDGFADICLVSPKTKEEIVILTSEDGHKKDPFWSNDGKIIFYSSDVDGIYYNIYGYNLETKEVAQVTNCVGGAFAGATSPQGGLIFVSYYQGGYSLYLIENLKLTWKKPEVAATSTTLIEIESIKKAKIKEYERKFSFDWRSGNFVYNSSQGISASLQLSASDVLGNHRFMLLLDNASSLSNETNFQLSYSYLTKKPDFRVGVFNWSNFYSFSDKDIAEREYGIVGMMDYPFSKFRRVELSFVSEVVSQEKIVTSGTITQEKAGMDYLSVALVEDTTNWSYWGPLNGVMSRVSIEQTIPLLHHQVSYTNFKIDYRKYIRITQRANWAFHLLSKVSKGSDRREFPLGGRRLFSISEAGSLRGYEVGEFWGNYILLGNAELRIPLIDEIRFAMPVSIRNIRSVLFVDAGSAWSKGERLTTRHNSTDEKKETDLKCSYGVGLRILLGFLPLRIDYAWNTDFVDTFHKTNFSIGYDF
ncbi:MAG: BamA/TamA family outer membrane protein [bacterium]|nr:BamA/TamA family outer membrane protein [bacterium]